MGIVLDLIEAMVAADPDDIASRAENEAQLLEQLQQSPQLIGELLERYPKTSSKDTQKLIRELLITSQHPQIEQYALEQVASGDPHKVSVGLVVKRGRIYLITDIPHTYYSYPEYRIPYCEPNSFNSAV